MPRFNGIIKKAYIKKFRKFSEVEIQCGSKLTIIAGQNGTQKTTLLGLLAHPFSMPHKKDKTGTFNTFPTITNQSFESKFADKFNIQSVIIKSNNDIYNKRSIYYETNNLRPDKGATNRARPYSRRTS